MRFTHVDIWTHGGVTDPGVYLALFLMWLAALSIVLERWLRFRGIEPEAMIEAAGLERQSDGFGPEIQRQAMELAVRSSRREMSRGLRTLMTLAITTPLVGLLGTLSGTIRAFELVALSGSESSSILPAAVSQALVPTAMGLAFGLVSFWSYAYLENRLDKLTLRMTRHASTAFAARRALDTDRANALPSLS